MPPAPVTSVVSSISTVSPGCSFAGLPGSGRGQARRADLAAILEPDLETEHVPVEADRRVDVVDGQGGAAPQARGSSSGGGAL
jgi:hypothetical protein